MKRTIRATTICVLVFALVLFLFAGYFATINATYAYLPSEYKSAAKDPDDIWYFGEDFLNLDALKISVAKWFEDERVYDFSDLEKDPVVVAVVDSGINTHHQLFLGKYDEDGNAVQTDEIGEYDVLLRDTNGDIVCTNTVVEKKYVSDSIEDDAPDRHGTHVAGIVATLIHELNLEKYIKIMPIKAAYPSGDASKFSLTALTNALNFAVEHGADVINLSLADTERAFGTIMSNKIADQAVLVAAAGNKKANSKNTIYYPAGSDNVIGVMNLSHSGENYVRSDKSNYGDAYALGAPGTAILSADGTGDAKYKKLGGTSMASPIVAFGAALATLKYSALAKATGEQNAKTPRQIANIVKASTKNDSELRPFDMNIFAADSGVYSVYLECDENLLSQTVGAKQAVSFKATLLPENNDNSALAKKIKWYEIPSLGAKTFVGEGDQLDYTPQDDIGEYTIQAEYVDGEETVCASKKISVHYKKPSADDSVIEETDEQTEYNVGETYTFQIENYEHYSPTDVVQWYVNGEYKGSGPTFEFTPESYGEYEITVKLNSTVIDSKMVISISEPRAQVEKVYSFVSIGVVGGILLVVGLVLMVYFARKKKRDNDDIA